MRDDVSQIHRCIHRVSALNAAFTGSNPKYFLGSYKSEVEAESWVSDDERGRERRNELGRLVNASFISRPAWWISTKSYKVLVSHAWLCFYHVVYLETCEEIVGKGSACLLISKTSIAWTVAWNLRLMICALPWWMIPASMSSESLFWEASS